MTEWVDFKKVKAAVNMQMALDHYGISGLTRSGDELRGPCPIHKGSQRSKQFTVNVSKNAFKCFAEGCGERGNVLDFVAAIERCSVRDAALKLQEWFEIGESELSSAHGEHDPNEPDDIPRGIYRDQTGNIFEVVAVGFAAESCERVVVYRELYAEFRFLVMSLQTFVGSSDNEVQNTPKLELIKTL